MPSPENHSPATIVFVLPSFAGGGAERVVLNLLKLVDRRYFLPVLVVLDGSGPLAKDTPADVPVHVLGTPQLRRSIPALVGVLRRLRPAVIFSTFTHVNLALIGMRPLLKRTRIVVREANLPSLSFKRLPWPAAFSALSRRLYPRADRLIASSMRMVDEFRALGVPKSTIEVLHNPVDVASLRARVGAVAEGSASDHVQFVAVGRLVPQKGFDRLLDAMAVLGGDSRCTIIGDGPERSALEKQAAEQGLRQRVAFSGFVNNPAPMIAAADALVMPSRFEGMPNAALEALALGTPVIATPAAGGISEIEGVIIAEAGPPLVAAMRAVSRKEANSQSLLPEAFSMEHVADRFNRLLRELT